MAFNAGLAAAGASTPGDGRCGSPASGSLAVGAPVTPQPKRRRTSPRPVQGTGGRNQAEPSRWPELTEERLYAHTVQLASMFDPTNFDSPEPGVLPNVVLMRRGLDRLAEEGEEVLEELDLDATTLEFGAGPVREAWAHMGDLGGYSPFRRARELAEEADARFAAALAADLAEVTRTAEEVEERGCASPSSPASGPADPIAARTGVI